MLCIQLQAQYVMAGIITALSKSIAANPQHITNAFRCVFEEEITEPPTVLHWDPCPNMAGCWVAEVSGAQDDVYTVNLLTGVAMCNGQDPSHLPAAILQHQVYHTVFMNMDFEVNLKRSGGHEKYVTVHSIDGCFYSWCLEGDNLIVTETRDGQTLELLPCAFSDFLTHLLVSLSSFVYAPVAY